MSKQRAARFLLWGGLAVFLAGVLSCGVGCLGAADSSLNNNPESEQLVGAVGVGMWLTIISILMVMSGAILKAVSGGGEKEN